MTTTQTKDRAALIGQAYNNGFPNMDKMVRERVSFYQLHQIFKHMTTPAIEAATSELEAENKALREGMKEANGALKSAEELNKWIASNISSACYENKVKGVSVEDTKPWEEMDDSMRNGWLASYREEFYIAINRINELLGG